MRRLFLSFFGTGFLKPAPGTWGSLAAIPAAWPLVTIGGPFLLFAAAIAAYAGGVAATRAEAEATGEHDPGWIVIDEVVGQWIALMPVAVGAWRSDISMFALWPGVAVAFILFRVFDIWKPGPIGTADARDDATGVMLDDVWAGLFAAVCVIALAFAAHAGFVAGIPDQP